MVVGGCGQCYHATHAMQLVSMETVFQDMQANLKPQTTTADKKAEQEQLHQQPLKPEPVWQNKLMEVSILA